MESTPSGFRTAGANSELITGNDPIAVFIDLSNQYLTSRPGPA
ncbi:hypothetical protein Rcae01_04992 [Novipirellula caenicola]|uniref:Uncharacterized protein n=1 Tax=Novipirellula caenicola TaxID=1536901 RepID=A0ABP9VZ35_9BACT